jgi:hypothetical protein
MKIIIWGYPLHIGYETYWFDDNNYPKDFDYNDCLFITEGHADNNIPLVDTSIYFVHFCHNPEKYINKVKRLIDMRYLVDGIKDYNYNYILNKEQCIKISNCTYYEKLYDNGGVASQHDNPKLMEYECVYTCWATDLLPDEIKEKNIYLPRENKIYWFGSANQYNTKEIFIFSEECKKNGIEFIANDPWKNPLPFEVVQQQTMKSIMAPDFRSSGDPNKIAIGETGTCHKQIGYLACRIFKSISYGHLGITNSLRTHELFNNKLIYNSNESQIFYDAMNNLNNYSLIKEQMKMVKEEHTYLNRIQDLLKII